MQAWIDERKRHRLSHAYVRMVRELGMNPEKLGKLENHRQEPWKMPLRQYIEHLYLKTFGRPCPDSVLSIEDRFDATRQSGRRKVRAGGRPGPRRSSAWALVKHSGTWVGGDAEKLLMEVYAVRGKAAF